MKTHDPEIRGRHVLLAVGKNYEARTLNYAIERALNGEALNSEQRLCLVQLRCQLHFHFKRKDRK